MRSNEMTHLEPLLKSNSTHYNAIGLYIPSDFLKGKMALKSLQVLGYMLFWRASTYSRSFFFFFIKYHICQSSCHSELKHAID